MITFNSNFCYVNSDKAKSLEFENGICFDIIKKSIEKVNGKIVGRRQFKFKILRYDCKSVACC